MTVYNHLLFSEIFFQQIRKETTDLDNLHATLSSEQATPVQLVDFGHSDCRLISLCIGCTGCQRKR